MKSSAKKIELASVDDLFSTEEGRQYAVHQHMALVPPVELIPPLIVLVGGRVDAEGAVRIAFRVVFLGELVLCKGFWIVLLRVCHDGRGIQANKT